MDNGFPAPLGWRANEPPILDTSMAEAPVYTTPEIPVPDPHLFLLNDANRTFIEQRNEYMILQHSPSGGTLSVTIGIGAAVLLLGMVLMGVSDLPAQYNTLAFLVIVVGGVGALLAFLRYLYRDVPVKGWIIPGVVTHGEKIRVVENYHTREYIGVRYQFAAPGGVVMDGYAEGESDKASHTMAPPPGTLVKIWLDDDGTHYLL
jgi:hypothetical protein